MLNIITAPFRILWALAPTAIIIILVYSFFSYSHSLQREDMASCSGKGYNNVEYVQCVNDVEEYWNYQPTYGH